MNLELSIAFQRKRLGLYTRFSVESDRSDKSSTSIPRIPAVDINNLATPHYGIRCHLHLSIRISDKQVGEESGRPRIQ